MTTTEIIALILQGVVVPLIIWGIYEIKNYLSAKIANANAQRILSQATDAAEKAVRETMQTYVDAIKNTPDWGAETQAIALGKAKETALTILGEEGLKLLQRAVGDANTYIETAIEAAVAQTKEG